MSLSERADVNQVPLHGFREGEPPCEPTSHWARTEPRPPRITKPRLERLNDSIIRRENHGRYSQFTA
jgi:hypothetical protein